MSARRALRAVGEAPELPSFLRAARRLQRRTGIIPHKEDPTKRRDFLKTSAALAGAPVPAISSRTRSMASTDRSVVNVDACRRPRSIRSPAVARSYASVSMASGTGLFDQWAQRWDPGILDVLGLGVEHLGALVDLDQPVRGLRAEFGARWPALAHVPWFPALGDGACSNVGRALAPGCTGVRLPECAAGRYPS